MQLRWMSQRTPDHLQQHCSRSHTLPVHVSVSELRHVVVGAEESVTTRGHATDTTDRHHHAPNDPSGSYRLGGDTTVGTVQAHNARARLHSAPVTVATCRRQDNNNKQQQQTANNNIENNNENNDNNQHEIHMHVHPKNRLEIISHVHKTFHTRVSSTQNVRATHLDTENSLGRSRFSPESPESGPGH